jgi:hypothetical protein
MITDPPRRIAARCGCHEWHLAAAIGGWIVRRGGNELLPARDWAETGRHLAAWPL